MTFAPIADAVQLIDSLLKAIKTVAGSLRDALKTGYEMRDMVAARQTRRAIIALVGHSTELDANQSLGFMNYLEAFIESGGNSEDWEAIKEFGEDLSVTIAVFLEEAQGIKNDLVLEKSFRDLVLLLKTRQHVISQLFADPRTPLDVEGVRLFRDRYLVLIRQLREVTDALAEYSEPKTPSRPKPRPSVAARKDQTH